jgi:hypothetical protein
LGWLNLVIVLAEDAIKKAIADFKTRSVAKTAQVATA